MMYRLLLLIITTGICKISYSQIGGNYTFAFLNLQPSARIAAMGGTYISVVDADVNMAYQNPALLNPSMNNQLSYNIVNYFTDIQYGYTGYARDFGKIGTFAAGLHYINYGDFDGRDENGATTGNFRAGENCFHLGYSIAYSKQIRFGANIKYASSKLYNYSAKALLADLAVNFKSKDSLFDAAFIIKNTGTMLDRYTSAKEPLPFEVQAGITYKPKHAPVRISIVGTNLQTSQTTFLNPDKPKKFDFETQQEIPEKITLAYKIFSHLNFGTEFLLGKNIQFRLGYNPRKAREMKLEGVRGFSGFSYGFGFRVKRFSISYGSALYFTGKSSFVFSFAYNFEGINLKKRK